MNMIGPYKRVNFDLKFYKIVSLTFISKI